MCPPPLSIGSGMCYWRVARSRGAQISACLIGLPPGPAGLGAVPWSWSVGHMGCQQLQRMPWVPLWCTPFPPSPPAPQPIAGCMRESRIGAGNAGSGAGANSYDQRRTSSSMLLDPAVQAQRPSLRKLVRAFQQQVRGLLDASGACALTPR